MVGANRRMAYAEDDPLAAAITEASNTPREWHEGHHQGSVDEENSESVERE